MIEEHDVAMVAGIICTTGRCGECARKARDVIATFDATHRLLPADVSSRIFTEWRWRNVKNGAEQTALVPTENETDWERIKRRSGRWYGPWETADE